MNVQLLISDTNIIIDLDVCGLKDSLLEHGFAEIPKQMT